MILYEATVMKTINININLANWLLVWKVVYLDFYFIPKSIADGSKT